MTLKTQMTSDLAAFFNTDEFADSITYTPDGGDPATISAIVVRDAPLQEPYVRGEQNAACIITVKTVDVASPQRGDKYTISSEDWYMDVDGVVYQDDNVLEIALERELS